MIVVAGEALMDGFVTGDTNEGVVLVHGLAVRRSMLQSGWLVCGNPSLFPVQSRAGGWVSVCCTH